MRNTKLASISNLSDITAALSHYDGLHSYISQLDSSQEGCKTIYERLVKHSRDGKYVDHVSYDVWSNIDLHIVDQMWGSTSCGWGGMGGAAMTNSYTMVIENSALSIACIYYGGKLAYILDMDKNYSELVSKGYNSLPGINEIKYEDLTALYIFKR